MVSTTENRITYAGNGVTTVFSFPYYVKSVNDMRVFVSDDTTSVPTQLVPNVDFTVSGAYTSGFGYLSGVNITIPGSTLNVPAVIPTGESLAIVRDPSLLQSLSLPVNSSYPPQPTESEFDALTLMVQRLYDLVSRAMVLKDSEIPPFDTTLPSGMGNLSNAGKTVVINATADGFDLSTPTGSGGGGGILAVPSFVLIDVSGGDQSVTLPSALATPNTLIVYINKASGSANKIDVGVTGGDTINQETSDSIYDGEVRWYLSDNVSMWAVVN